MRGTIYCIILLSVITLLGLTSCKTPSPPSNNNSWAEKTLSSMTLEQKVAQLVCVDINGSYLSDDDPKFQQWISLARDHGVGGFVIYGGSPEGVGILLNKLQGVSKIPLLISTDFEGGPGQQVTGASEFPSNMAFAATGDTDLMYRAAKAMAAEGRSMGIHLSYTPVTDVSLSPDNPQESGRSFGGDIDLLNTMIRSYVKGYHDAGMLCTSKHFPGRGDMKGGPAYPSFTTINKSLAELDSNEFKAFRYAIDAGVDFMMTEHIAIPSITDGSMEPASVESKLAKKIIRDHLGFKGILTSDDLWYDHVIARFGKDDIAVKALEAGHDIVLKPKDPVTAMKAIVDAVNSGRLSIAQIDESVFKLLAVKESLDLHQNRLVAIDSISSVVGITTHKALVQEVADRSITLLKNNNILPLGAIDMSRVIHITIQKDDEQPNVKKLMAEMSTAFPGMKQYSLRPAMSKVYYEDLLKASAAADLIIFSFFVQRDRHGDPAPLRKEDIDLIERISASKPGKVVAMSFGNPHLIRKLNTLPSFLVGYGEGGFYGNQPVYFSSLIRILKNELIPNGKLPLKVTDALPIGFGLTYDKP